jgi:hypothetical protein
MSTDRDTTRIVRSWLEEGPTVLPDRVLDAVLDQVPATRQRRALWPAWRLLPMNTPLRLAGGIAAVAVVAVLGFALLSGPGGLVGTGQTPGPSPTTRPTPVPSPTPIAVEVTGPSASLDPGTYVFSDAGKVDTTSVATGRFTFTVPAGWSQANGFVTKHTEGPGEVLLTTWIVTDVYADVCHWQGTMVRAGTTADELVKVLLAQKGRIVSAATDAVIGGQPAKRIEMTVPADLDVSKCDPGAKGSGIVRFWPDPGPDESGGLCCSAVGSTDVVYVIDVAGKPFVVVARHQPGSSQADIAELDGIVASIRIVAPPRPSPSISPSP